MLDDSEATAAARERLSALLDGELDAGAVAPACAQWRASAGARATWHAYHLIGDVLRSDDLANGAAHDAGFLVALRTKLADEPVVLAPESAAANGAPAPGRGGSRRWDWMAPSAVAAGFVVVAGVLTLTLTRPGALPGGSEATSVAQVAAPASLPGATVPDGNAAAASEPQTFVASGQVIRDARLDRYLNAHKQFAGSSVLGVPSAYLRNATADVSGR